MAKILIIYSTIDGHTQKICERIKKTITKAKIKCDIFNIEELILKDIEPVLSNCDKIVLGSSIRFGYHHQLIYKLINAYQSILDSKPNAFFSVNLVARKPEKSTALTNPYLQKFLKQIRWKPKKIAVFAGRLEYSKYTFFNRQAMRLIMFITKGPTASNTVIEYTDWQQVDNFAISICEM